MSYTQLTLTGIITLFLGVALFLFHNNRIIILPRPERIEQAPSKIQKSVPFFYPHSATLKKEDHTLIWPYTTSAALRQLVTEWCMFMHQENKLSKKIGVQSVALNTQSTAAYISLDTIPFTKQQSTATKLLIIEALLKTIQVTIPTIQTVMLLINQAPINDPHIDFSQPLPIHGYSDMQPDIPPKKISHKAPYTLVLEHTGRQNSKGRTIDDTFERVLAFDAAHALKKQLEQMLPITIRVPRISHKSDVLHHTAYTNNPDTDLVISLNFYQHSMPLPHCALYYFMRNSTTDFWNQRKNSLCLEPYNQAYRTSMHESYTYAMHLHSQLIPTANVLTHTVFGIPYQPLTGIIKPAISLEIGIKECAELQTIIPIIARAITAILS